MVRQFEKLSKEEADLLLKAPALVSVYVSSSLNRINAARKADAIKLSHLKSFTAHALLIPYYIEVEKGFKADFENIVQQYAPLDAAKRNQLKKLIEQVFAIINKLEASYATLLNNSLAKYANHVRHGDRTPLEYFVFPYPLPGLMD